MNIGRKIGVAALIGMPVLTLVAWLASGRQVLTKAVRHVPAPVQDELWGPDQTFVTQRGPVAGYFIGLDAVIAATLVCGALLLVIAIVRVRRRKSQRLGAGVP
ncbi:MAG TPA: hypothetical protein VGM03_00860 [Phycisphaerae bacterium]|jgi:hypothetical protein